MLQLGTCEQLSNLAGSPLTADNFGQQAMQRFKHLFCIGASLACYLIALISLESVRLKPVGRRVDRQLQSISSCQANSSPCTDTDVGQLS